MLSNFLNCIHMFIIHMNITHIIQSCNIGKNTVKNRPYCYLFSLLKTNINGVNTNEYRGLHFPIVDFHIFRLKAFRSPDDDFQKLSFSKVNFVFVFTFRFWRIFFVNKRLEAGVSMSSRLEPRSSRRWEGDLPFSYGR